MAKKSKKYRLRKQTKRGYNRFLNSLSRKDKIYEGGFSKTSAVPYIPAQERKPNTCIIDEYKLSSTLDFLFNNPNIFHSGSASVPSDGVLFLPETFSLTENPEPSFEFLKDLLYTLRYPKNNKLVLNYRKCKRIDLDASICKDIILKEFINAFDDVTKRGINIETKSIEAIELSNERVKKFLYATGTHKIIKNIKVDFPDIQSYDLVIGDKRDGIAYKEVESTNMVKHIEKCLAKMDMKLTNDARERFGEIVGEVIANAEEHNITNYHYSLGHFEEIRANGKHYGVFQVVIFNFGESIYERFNNPEACKNVDILNDMRTKSRAFTNKSYFGIFGGRRFEEETLWTLYSLQDQVSSVAPTRGNGTIQFIESFLDLRNNDEEKISKLVLLSGNSRILFDGKYRTALKPKESEDEDDYKIITFNEEKSLDEKPDPDYVTFVEHFFPGTMIYARIAINEDDIIKNEDRQN
jgi:hypothetical protein